MRGRLLMVAALLLAGCGVQSQQTPEPSETDRINQLVEQLGTQRTYNSQTLIMNAEPDGRVLLKWLDRRKATLDGTLPLTQRPALTNPGSISATLVWELETENGEGRPSNAFSHYMLDSETRKFDCPRSSEAEAQWFNQERAAHAKGQRSTLIDWQATSARFQTRCDIESQAAANLEEAEREAAQTQDARLVQEELACRAPWEAAERAYTDAPSSETGGAASAASRIMNQCLRGIEGQRRNQN